MIFSLSAAMSADLCYNGLPRWNTFLFVEPGLLSLAFFRFASRSTPLPRTMLLPLLGGDADLHPMDYTHVGRTREKAPRLWWGAATVIAFQRI